MAESWQNSPPNHAEEAILLIRNLVAAERQCGKKTIASLMDVAEALQMPRRKPRHLFERDRVPFVGIDEYTRISLLGISYLRRIIDRMRAHADRWEAEADLMELNYLQSRGTEWNLSGDASPQKRAA